MPDESKYNTAYSAADIERYLSGKMPPQEMHRLEKAALDDPFLADALEGYAFTQTPAQDAAALQGELEKKIQPAKVVPLKKSFNSRLLKAAALILFMAGAGVATYQYNFDSSSKDIALQKSERAAPYNDPEAPAPAETADSAAGDVAFETYQRKEAAPEAASATAPAPQNQQKPAKIAWPRPRVQRSAEERTAVTHADTVSANTDMVQGNEVAGAPMKMRAAETKAPAALPPAPARDSEVLVVGYGTRKQKKEAALNEDQRTLRQDSSAVPEVVLGKAAGLQTHKPIVTFEEVEPAQGPTYLDDYIANNLKTPEDLNVKPGRGEITLSFDVDESGRAVNIKVEKSLCEVCDKEAVRVIKEGPKWVKKKKNKKGIVNIRF